MLDAISCSFGARPSARVRDRIDDTFGRVYPPPSVLRRMPRAMRREAALLADEAGLARPSGAFTGRASPVIAAGDTASDAMLRRRGEKLICAPGYVIPVDAMSAFLADHVTPYRGGSIAAEDLRQRFFAACPDLIPADNPAARSQAAGRAMRRLGHVAVTKTIEDADGRARRTRAYEGITWRA